MSIYTFIQYVITYNVHLKNSSQHIRRIICTAIYMYKLELSNTLWSEFEMRLLYTIEYSTFSFAKKYVNLE